MKKIFDDAYENFKQLWEDCMEFFNIFTNAFIAIIVGITVPLWFIPYKVLINKSKKGTKHKLTNYERIKAMSVDEMVEFIADCGSCDNVCNSCAYLGNNSKCAKNGCLKGIREHLESEVQENDRT